MQAGFTVYSMGFDERGDAFLLFSISPNEPASIRSNWIVDTQCRQSRLLDNSSEPNELSLPACFLPAGHLKFTGDLSCRPIWGRFGRIPRSGYFRQALTEI